MDNQKIIKITKISLLSIILIVSISYAIFHYLILDEYEKPEFSNPNDSDRYNQMTLALNQVPPGVDLKNYRHFHVSNSAEDKFRMASNFEEALLDDAIKVLSISCENYEQCVATLSITVDELNSKEFVRTDLLLMLPSNMPTSFAEKVSVFGAKIKIVNKN